MHVNFGAVGILKSAFLSGLDTLNLPEHRRNPQSYAFDVIAASAQASDGFVLVHRPLGQTTSDSAVVFYNPQDEQPEHNRRLNCLKRALKRNNASLPEDASILRGFINPEAKNDPDGWVILQLIDQYGFKPEDLVVDTYQNLVQ